MSGTTSRDERHGVQFSLAVDPAPCEMARDATRVGALVTVTARRGGGQESCVPGAVLRLTLDRRFRLESVRQVRPVWKDLTGRCAPQDGGVADVPLLAWGEETRDYHVMLSADPAALPGEEMRAARVDIVAGQAGKPLPSTAPAAITVRRLPYEGPGPVDPTATWVHDMGRLIAAMRAGTGACGRGDRDTALRELTKAVKIARRIGARRHLEDLKRLVTIDEFGEVRLRDDITRAGLLETAACSGVTGDVRRPGEPGKPDPGGDARAEPPLVRRKCPDGHVTVAPKVSFCEEPGCGYKFPD